MKINKKIYFTLKLIIISIVVVLHLSLNASAVIIVFKDGKIIEAEKTWEKDGKVFFEINGLEGFTQKHLIERIVTDEAEMIKAKADYENKKVWDAIESRKKKEKEKREKPVFREENESCFNLGYRYGLCATKGMHGIPCKPENDIVIPERCREKEETSQGIKAGVKAVYASLNLNKRSSTSSSSLSMLTTPLDVLEERLKGKTKSEVRRLVGSPNRIMVYAGNKCWIYGNTYTDKDRGIVFDGDRVLTVTFY